MWARHLARIAIRTPLHDAHQLLLVPLGQAPLLARIRRKLLHVARQVLVALRRFGNR
jgi:hypothetical protein